jgi:predicted nucleic acid-binding protein
VHKEITLDQAHRILGQLGKLVDSIPKVEVSRRSTLQIAVEETITYYDASFIAAAISSKSALITDDSGLASVAKKHVRTASSDDL